MSSPKNGDSPVSIRYANTPMLLNTEDGALMENKEHTQIREESLITELLMVDLLHVSNIS